jgi:ADP-dependent NAD(P)H-hydrate dehydratase
MPSPTANSSPRRIKSAPKIPPRPIDGQKGLFGRVLIFGGSDDMIGAPILAGAAALRMGSGLVQVAMPRAVLASALSAVPELIGLALDEAASSDDLLLEAAEQADIIAVGPGLGKSESARRRVDALIRIQKPMVIDADALNYLSTLITWPSYFAAQAVLTPHPGEMKRLGKLIGITEVPKNKPGRIDVATKAAKAFRQIIVLKGHRTVVTDAKRLYINKTGDSSLSKAGSGDILTGIIASLIGQKMDPFDAACAATKIHGRAGELAGKKLGRRSVLARDVIDAIPQALKKA